MHLEIHGYNCCIQVDVNVKMKENFLDAFVLRHTLRTHALTARKHVWLFAPPAALSQKWPISRPHDSHSQYSVVVTQLHTNCSSFYLPRRNGSQSQACPLRGWMQLSSELIDMAGQLIYKSAQNAGGCKIIGCYL